MIVRCCAVKGLTRTRRHVIVRASDHLHGTARLTSVVRHVRLLAASTTLVNIYERRRRHAQRSMLDARSLLTLLSLCDFTAVSSALPQQRFNRVQSPRTRCMSLACYRHFPRFINAPPQKQGVYVLLFVCLSLETRTCRALAAGQSDQCLHTDGGGVLLRRLHSGLFAKKERILQLQQSKETP